MGQTTSVPQQQHAAVASPTSIPAGCPMHQSEAAPSPPPPAKCPVDHASMAKAKASTGADHASASAAASRPAACPIQHDGPNAQLNPLNQMPNLSQEQAANQSTYLPTDRTISSIPRDSAEKWEYPSPQQFYNALVRKGWETPEEHIETMVEIHNFLNEEAWLEVLKWEKRQNENIGDLQLVRFKGRPGEMSPKARFWMFAGWLLPSRFNTEPPFDRHDWIIRRPQTGEEVRYVIDYYSAPPDPHGSPVFSLDVRPALDSLSSVKERITVATEEAWASFKENNPETGAHGGRA